MHISEFVVLPRLCSTGVCALQVQTLKPGGSARWRPVEDFLAAGDPGGPEVVVAVRFPPVRPGDVFWSYKVCPQGNNDNETLQILCFF